MKNMALVVWLLGNAWLCLAFTSDQWPKPWQLLTWKISTVSIAWLLFEK